MTFLKAVAATTGWGSFPGFAPLREKGVLSTFVIRPTSALFSKMMLVSEAMMVLIAITFLSAVLALAVTFATWEDVSGWFGRFRFCLEKCGEIVADDGNLIQGIIQSPAGCTKTKNFP